MGLTRPAIALSAACILTVLVGLSSTARASRPDVKVHHDLVVTVSPEERRLSARDTVTLKGEGQREVTFVLHGGLQPSSPTPGVSIARMASIGGEVPREVFRLDLSPGVTECVIEYGGTIHHPLESYASEQARGFRSTPGIISGEGVFLDGASLWYPAFDSPLLTFSLTVSLPRDWYAVSQGSLVFHEEKSDAAVTKWESADPQDEIYLVAARFVEYAGPPGRVRAMVFLREPDDALAKKYLDATSRYITMYEALLGPYPYNKFALVENFWETGFGMPSFTLLGPKVIRFPFIIDSSYPHEILHNWWGNGVFPAYDKGNWSEGLTAYLSDHLIKEQQGGGSEYRQATLQKYADYVIRGRDFPLTEFRSRHSAPSEAVGYGKSLMFFHMLRMELGDDTFVAGLQRFYRTFKFSFASFDDLRESLESASGRSLAGEFSQWVTRTGAPKLELGGVKVTRDGDGYLLSARLSQAQEGEPYLLRVPIAVTMKGQERAYQTTVPMDRREAEIKVPLPHRPLRLDVDPEFDVFRRLGRGEIPPAISQVLGAERMLILLPSSSPARMLKSYRELAESLVRSGQAAVEVALDADVRALPSDRAVVVLGWENRFAGEIATALAVYGVKVSAKTVQIEGRDIPVDGSSFVFTSRSARNPDLALMLIATDRSDALPGLGRKLPHYHKYSYLIFDGPEPANTAKGRWPVIDSPMTAYLADDDGIPVKVEMARLATRAPLVKPPLALSGARMVETVRVLSSLDMEGRGIGSSGLDRAAEYIAGRFRESGLKPGGTDGGYYQTWACNSGEPDRSVTLKNVIGVIPGQEAAAESVVVGAHYDHLGLGWPDVREGNKGKIHPGADDNASGVAVLLELADAISKGPKPDRTIVFVAFTGEEASRLGSTRYVTDYTPYSARKALGVINLDTVGRLGRNKLLLLGANSADEWVHIFRGAGFVSGVEVEPGSQDLDASDQVSFLEVGVPAVQLTTGPHLDYHCPGDTADKIDESGLVKVASVAREAVTYLAGREGPLTPSIRREGTAERSAGRKVSLGTVPDFAFPGPGIRLSGVVPDSPAAASGLKQGDVLTEANGVRLDRIKDLSEFLKTLKAGTRVVITFLRDGVGMTAETEVVAR
ncbi:MAG: M20/M25/M40 family metallo-hydrolase [Chloroflexota bacterium]